MARNQLANAAGRIDGCAIDESDGVRSRSAVLERFPGEGAGHAEIYSRGCVAAVACRPFAAIQRGLDNLEQEHGLLAGGAVHRSASCTDGGSRASLALWQRD